MVLLGESVVERVGAAHIGTATECFIDDLLGHNAAFTTLSAYAQLFAYLTQAGSAAIDSVFDLTVSNTFTEAYVHNLITLK